VARVKTPWLYPAVFTGSLMPLAVLLIRAATGTLGADPVAIALNRFGLLALVFLLLSLACTPLKIVFGWIWPIGLRKTLGLFGFFHACLHFLTYSVIDQGLKLGQILKDILERKFIFVGFSALVLLVPLAVTSTAKMTKRLGARRWKRLHRLAYATASLAVIHFVLRVKKDVSEPAVYGAVLAVLFAIRIGSFLLKRWASARITAASP
jgi:methionine sulfoxide reductase heme-binding subunit